MVTGVNQAYCGDHVEIYTNSEPCCTPESNIMLYVNYTSVKRKKERKEGRKEGRREGGKEGRKEGRRKK